VWCDLRPAASVAPVTLYLVVGLPGAGKTTRARELEATLPALRLTPDEWQWALFPDDGPEDWRERECAGHRAVRLVGALGFGPLAVAAAAGQPQDQRWSRSVRSARYSGGPASRNHSHSSAACTANHARTASGSAP
jgi:hypothetical protein